MFLLQNQWKRAKLLLVLLAQLFANIGCQAVVVLANQHTSQVDCASQRVNKVEVDVSLSQ